MRSVTESNGRNAVSNAVSNGTPTQPNPTQPYPTYRTTTTEPKPSSSSLGYVLSDAATLDDAAWCCFPPCSEPKVRGTYFCAAHARRWNRGGERANRKAPPLERFCATGWTERIVVEALGPCWEWNGGCNRYGYGNFAMPGARSAHRAAYVIEHGSVPSGLQVLHECDNPPCVNPAHLTAGTRSDNMRAMWDRDRHPTRKIADADVIAIRSRYTGARGEQVAIAREYGVSSNQINLIVRGLARRRAIAKAGRASAPDVPGETPTRMMPGGAR